MHSTLKKISFLVRFYVTREKAAFNTSTYFYEARPKNLGGISFSGDLAAVIRGFKPYKKAP